MVLTAVLQNMPMFAIMEDDLMPVGDVREVRTTSLRPVITDLKKTATGPQAAWCVCKSAFRVFRAAQAAHTGGPR